jgi:hypothetical protein
MRELASLADFDKVSKEERRLKRKWEKLQAKKDRKKERKAKKHRRLKSEDEDEEESKGKWERYNKLKKFVTMKNQAAAFF